MMKRINARLHLKCNCLLFETDLNYFQKSLDLIFLQYHKSALKTLQYVHKNPFFFDLINEKNK
jgi:hypothetical protein